MWRWFRRDRGGDGELGNGEKGRWNEWIQRRGWPKKVSFPTNSSFHFSFLFLDQIGHLAIESIFVKYSKVILGQKMSSFHSYYYEENEEREEEEEWADDREIHRTVHHLVEEIVEECENWSTPSSPAPSLPEMPKHFENWPTNRGNSLRKTPSTISSQSAEMEFSSEENEEGMGEEEGSSHFPVVLAKQPPSYEEVAKRFRSMRKLAQEREGMEEKSNLPGPSNSPPFARQQEKMQGKMSEKLPNSEGIEMASLERGQPKMGSGRKIGPAELEKNQNLRKIDKNMEEEKRRQKMSGPRRAFLLFCATLLSLILSSLIVIFVLISFNPTR